MKEDKKMIKRLLIGFMCVGLMTLFVKEADAGFNISITGLKINTIHCNSLIRGIGTTYNNDTWIECVIFPVEVEATCANPGGEVGGSVVRFNLYGPSVAADEVVDPARIYANGRYESEIVIHDYQLYNGLDLASLNGVCDGFNNGSSEWTVAQPPNPDDPEDQNEGFVHVIKMFAAVRAWTNITYDADDNPIFEGATLEDDVQVAAYAPEGTNFDEPSAYIIDELCDKTKRVDCPASLAQYLCVNVHDENPYPVCESWGYEDLINEYFTF